MLEARQRQDSNSPPSRPVEPRLGRIGTRPLQRLRASRLVWQAGSFEEEGWYRETLKSRPFGSGTFVLGIEKMVTATDRKLKSRAVYEGYHRAFARSSFTVIEDNAIGAAVADNLDIPVHQLRRFTTSRASKERIIETLRRHLQLQIIQFSPTLTQLASELRDYRLPDTNCVQDSVIALAIAVEHAREAQAFKSHSGINKRLFRVLNPPAASRRPFSTGTITWIPAN